MRNGQQEMEPGLLAAQQRFEAWRAERTRGARIPNELWTLAVDMAGRHGLGRAVTALHLDYYSLKRRLPSCVLQRVEAKHRSRSSESKTPRPRSGNTVTTGSGLEAFVQLPSLGGASPSCRIEMQTPAGPSLRMEVVGATMADAIILAREFWSNL